MSIYKQQVMNESDKSYKKLVIKMCKRRITTNIKPQAGRGSMIKFTDIQHEEDYKTDQDSLVEFPSRENPLKPVLAGGNCRTRRNSNI